MSDEPLSAEGWFGEHEALWADPKPLTPEGQHLWRLFMLGKLGTSSTGVRDFGQRICQIEAEAVAALAAERDRLREVAERAARVLDLSLWSPDDFGEATVRETIEALRAALAPGTPVDVE